MKKNKLLLITMLVGAVLPFNVSADVSGTVYRDLPVDGTSLNTYGVKNTNELGVTGIAVTVTDSSGNVVGAPVVTDANGYWTVAGTSGDVRVEFGNIPNYLESSPVNSGSNTTVQFISDGGTANLGLHNPTDYSNTVDPLISIPRAEPNIVAGKSNYVLGSVAYSSTGLNSDYNSNSGSPAPGPVPNADADANEVGSIWGTAWQSDQQRLFAGSFLKRHAGMANGPGYVYVIDYNTTPTTVPHQFDLNGLTPANGGGVIDLGSVCRRSSTDGDPDSNCDPFTTGLAADYELPIASTDPSVDLDAFAKVGTIGLGDLDMQETAPVLWLVNPNQKALISVDVSAASVSLPGTVNQYPLATMTNWPTCTGGELRPWALSFNQGRGYLGVVCDASTSQSLSDLHAYVLSFDPENIASGLTSELDFSLDYARWTSAWDRIDFNVWVSNYPPAGMFNTSNYREYAQPLLSDIEFDKHGNMYLNFMDRWGHQVGSYNYEPISGNTTTIRSSVGGEILKVCNVSGSWELEGDTNCPVAWSPGTGGVMGNGEFFDDVAGDNTVESTEGSLAILKGSGQIVSSTMDPHPSGDIGADYWNIQGITTWGLGTGGIENWYAIEYGTDIDSGVWGKAHAIGDIEMLTAAAPLEIGNRIWDDTNSNGIQDAGEPAIQGVAVTLTCGGLTATSVSDVNGAWLIQDGDMTGGVDIPRNTACTISVPLVEPNNSKVITAQVSNTETGNDADPATGNFAITTGRSGQNNHTYDIGYRNASACSLTAAAVPSACTNVGNDADGTNDTFNLAVTVEGSNTGASTTYTYTSSSANISGGGTYSATAETDGAFVISATTSPFDLVITDSADNACTVTVSNLSAPATCSSAPAQVDIALSKTANPISAVSGDTVIYTLVATNNGPDDATGVVVSDPLPAGVTYVSDDGGADTTEVGGTVTWTIGNLVASASATLNITVTVD